ncbi:DNA polymerase III subunit gamma/tau [Chloroflexi bacterium TSY]|nr:DNA polymerase III subunit gamma/tau [Chloroflexi bacterium TSY]
MSQALYRKWRSQTFQEVVGQEHVTQTLRNALHDNRVAHAYLFAGPRGTGKTSSARILAKALNCTSTEKERPCNECASCVAITEGRMMDLIEIDAASNNSVDDVRELRDKVGFRPAEGQYKVYIIDEVHMLSTSAFNALLKTLEEPPPHARFVLATTEPHRIPATVISRCQRFDFRRIPVPEIVAHLQHIVNVEKFQAEDDALTAIARSAQGCMRDAISLLDQMLSLGSDRITLAQVQQVLGTVNIESVGTMVEAVTNQDVTKGLVLIQQLLYEGASLTEYCHQIVEYLRGILVIQMTGDPALLIDLPIETTKQMQIQAQQLDQTTTLFAIKRFGEAAKELKGGYHPQLPLEMALIELIRGGTVHGPAVSDSPTSIPVSPQSANQNALASTQSASPQQTIPSEQSKSLDKTARQSATSENSTVNPQVAQDQQIDSNEAGHEPKSEDSEDAPPPLDKAAVEKLHGQWDQFLADIREQCGLRVQGCLRSVRDIAIAESSVVFAFGNNTFSHGTIIEPEIERQVTAVLSHFLGRTITLECQMGMKAQLSSLHKSVQTAVDDDDGGVDPLVEYAVADLGAEIIADSEAESQ